MVDIDANGVVHVRPGLLLVAAVPLVCVALAGRRFELGLERALLVGIARSFFQLMALGWILQPIFALGVDSPGLVFFYVLLMVTITTKESMSRIKYTYRHHAILAFSAFFVSIAAVAAIAFLFIIRPDPRWSPQYIIPVCGMLMGNSISGVSLTTNTLSTQIMEGGRREIELYLSFGATGWESAGRLVRGAIAAGATPIVNSMNVIGLVSIPGMMTGQILGGSPVTEAAHYQILITWLICSSTFSSILANVVILYRVAFDAGAHVLRTDRFIEVARQKRKKSGTFADTWKEWCGGIGLQCKAVACCRGPWGRRQKHGDDETQPLSHHTGVEYGSSSSILSNKIRIQARSGGQNATPFFQISELQFSVPECHTHSLPHDNSATSLHSLASSLSDTGKATPQEHWHRRVLCSNLNTTLRKGEIGIVTGPSGSGKSTFLRVVSGLTPMDKGDVTVSGLSLAGCCGRAGQGIHSNMVQWRTAVRYVTQYKVDIPGTPRDFIFHIASFCSHTAHGDEELGIPSGEDMLKRTQSYLEQWGMGSFHSSPGEERDPYLDKEWKNLSGGESQRTLLAIAMASRPSVLLLDEATSGLDTETEKRVEESVVGYAKRHHAVVLWVTHSEDIAERILKQ